jgi:hypothetical protein
MGSHCTPLEMLVRSILPPQAIVIGREPTELAANGAFCQQVSTANQA